MKKNEKTKAKAQPDVIKSLTEPWISMRSGIIIMIITSIAFAVFVAWQVIPVKGLGMGILWGILAGLALWAIFLANFFLHRFLKH